MRAQRATPADYTRGDALLSEMRERPSRAWLESRPPVIVLCLAIMLGIPPQRGARDHTTAELIDLILAAEWERTRQ